MKKVFIESLLIIAFLYISGNSTLLAQEKTVRHRIRIGYDRGTSFKSSWSSGVIAGGVIYVSGTSYTVVYPEGNGINLQYTWNFWDYYKEYPGILTFGLISEVDLIDATDFSVNNLDVGFEVSAAGFFVQTGAGYSNFSKEIAFVKNEKIVTGNPSGIYNFAKLGLDIPIVYRFGIFGAYTFSFYQGEIYRNFFEVGISKRFRVDR